MGTLHRLNNRSRSQAQLDRFEAYPFVNWLARLINSFISCGEA